LPIFITPNCSRSTSSSSAGAELQAAAVNTKRVAGNFFIGASLTPRSLGGGEVVEARRGRHLDADPTGREAGVGHGDPQLVVEVEAQLRALCLEAEMPGG